ncbi:hypothetical protein [Larkinella rosea]
MGGASAIFWTLTFQTTLKYVLITLRCCFGKWSKNWFVMKNWFVIRKFS